MTILVVTLLGGVGLFLLGMLLLTDGLKAAAGTALKRILVRFTGRPMTAFFSGLALTALVQSSSATTLATIGLVSAGLLTFVQAIGVVIGGSVGTTTTGWLVSLLGLKLSVGKLALPLIGVGALMRLVLKGRPGAVGLALAGFGLIFVGIDTLQTGMAGLADRVRPESFPPATVAGRAVLVVAGVALTVLMQSSSAAIATTITAFHVGTLDLDQALSLVIGASIGTTVTAALASLGASVPARRTALAHILFNSFAGLVGFVVEPGFAWAVRRLQAGGELAPGAMSLAVFHSAFTLLGALIVLPGLHRLGRLVTRLVPDRGPALTRHLDKSLTEVPEVALEALRRTLVECARALITAIQAALAANRRESLHDFAPVQAALHEARSFLGRVPPFLPPRGQLNPRLALVHALDHLDRLVTVVSKAPSREVLEDENHLGRVRARLNALLDAATERLQTAAPSAPDTLQTLAREIAELRRRGREALLEETARGGLAPDTAAAVLDAVRWMDSAAYHLWRGVHHLSATGVPEETEGAEEGADNAQKP